MRMDASRPRNRESCVLGTHIHKKREKVCATDPGKRFIKRVIKRVYKEGYKEGLKSV